MFPRNLVCPCAAAVGSGWSRGTTQEGNFITRLRQVAATDCVYEFGFVSGEHGMEAQNLHTDPTLKKKGHPKEMFYPKRGQELEDYLPGFCIWRVLDCFNSVSPGMAQSG